MNDLYIGCVLKSSAFLKWYSSFIDETLPAYDFCGDQSCRDKYYYHFETLIQRKLEDFPACVKSCKLEKVECVDNCIKQTIHELETIDACTESAKLKFL